MASSPLSSGPTAPEAPTKTVPGVPLYTAGSLRYDRRSLAILFGWLLWGDFAFTFFEAIFSRFMPLYLKDLNASNTLIGIMTGGIAGAVNIFFSPHISQWSDRFRSRLGRRIPFLLCVTPITVLSLILVGFAPEIGAWCHRLLSNAGWIVSEQTVILTLLGVFVVSWHLFNMVLVNAYNWLLRDVVPQSVMARFLSWFRIVGTISSFLFLWYVFPSVVSHRQIVCTGVGIFYLVSFLAMCSQVREGTYPPPPVDDGPRNGFFTRFGRYFRECLGIPLYRNFFITYVLAAAAITSSQPFLTLFARDKLGLSMGDMGQLFAWSMLSSAVAYFPMGWLCDRYNPIRVTLAALVGAVVVSAVAYFWIHSRTGWMIYLVIMSIPSVGWWLGNAAVSMHLFPKEKFGQFSSGLNVFGCGGYIVWNYLIGQFMDRSGSDYRLVFVWSTLFFALAIVPMVAVYRGWKRHGGPHHYHPPMPGN